MNQLKVGVFNVLAAGMCGCSEIYKKIQEEEEKKKASPGNPQTSQGLDYAQEIFNYLLYLSNYNESEKLSKPREFENEGAKENFETKLVKLCGETNKDETNKGKNIDDSNRNDFIKYATNIDASYNLSAPYDLLKGLLNEVQLQQVINKFIDKNKQYIKVLELTNNDQTQMLNKYLEYCTLKESQLGKIIKEFCQSFPFDGGNGFGLYGGFKLGLGEPEANAQKPNIMSTGFRDDFYQKKADFMVEQIRKFFNNNDKGILVCPEYDYDIKLNKAIQEENTKIIQEENTKIIPLPCGNYLDSSKINNKTNFVSSTFKPQSINTEANFFRYVFYKGIKLELKNDLYEVQLKELKKCWKTNTENKVIPDSKLKNRVDVFYGYDIKDGAKENIKFVFIGVHLDSTTSMGDNFKKEKEIIALEELVVKIADNLKPTHPNLEIIIAGDFNFPYFLNEEKKKIEGSDNYIIPGFNSGGAVDVSKIEYWNYFKNNYKLSSPQRVGVGVCTKERFKSEMGNDQLWEGKGDKRSYNTDFIGRITVSDVKDPITFYQNNIIFTAESVQKKIMELERSSNSSTNETVSNPNNETQSVDNTLKDVRNENLLNPDTLFPYVKLKGNNIIDVDNSWLSDHSLVYSIIDLPTVSKGGARKSRLLRNIKKTNTNNNRNNRKKNNNKSTKKRKMNNRKKLSRKKNKKMRIKSKKN